MKKDKKHEFLDHLVEHPEDEQTPAAPEAPQTPEKNPNRAQALIRYVAILFAVAFLLVLFSFIVSMRDSKQTISELNKDANSSLARAEQLQDENRQLQEEKAELEDKIQELEDVQKTEKSKTEQLKKELEDVIKTRDELKEENTILSQKLESTAEAYELLLKAETALKENNDEDFKAIMEELSSKEAELGEVGKTALKYLKEELNDIQGN